MTQYKLTYFNIQGFGEPIRLILSYMGKDFEDKRITKQEWPELKKKTKFSKLPTLEIDGIFTCQSTAICKYLAIEAGLSGKNDWENFQIDMIMGTFMDFIIDNVRKYNKCDPVEKEELKQIIINKTIPYYFSLYEEQVEKHGYIATNSLTWVDIFFVSYCESLDAKFDIKCLDNFKNLKKLQEKVFNIPNIKKWIEKRPNIV